MKYFIYWVKVVNFFCNHGEICIVLHNCLSIFSIYFVWKIHDFLTSCLMKIGTFTTNLRSRVEDPGWHSFFLNVCMSVCSLNYNRITKKVYLFCRKVSILFLKTEHYNKSILHYNIIVLYYNKTLYYNKKVIGIQGLIIAWACWA